MILETAGCPEVIVRAYRAYMEHVEVHNMIAGGVGSGYKKDCSIPQGCPLSMMLIALVVRPWMIKMQELGAIPRILSNDLLVITEGPAHAVDFE